MARKPEIFLRDLESDEAQRLVKIARTSKDRVRLRRAGMALASMQGRSVPEIAVMFAAKQETVRELIKAFNDRGFAPDPKARRGSMPRIGPAVREQIARTAKCDPPGPARLPVHGLESDQAAELPGRAQGHPGQPGDDPLVLGKAGISFRTPRRGSTPPIRTSPPKLARILALYDQAPGDGRLICIDEFGPLNLMPRPGKGWYPVTMNRAGFSGG